MPDSSSSYAAVLALGVRVGSEPDLKAALLADPRAAILAETEASIPADLHVRAIEQADGTIALDLANDDLPDDYLALVTGAGYDESGCQDPTVIANRPDGTPIRL